MVPSKNIFVRFNVINGVSYLALNYDLFEVNEVGQSIWESIDGNKNLQSISAEVAEKFQAAAEEVSDDVKEFIELLLKKGLVEV
jgi:hypothetical protein